MLYSRRSRVSKLNLLWAKRMDCSNIMRRPSKRKLIPTSGLDISYIDTAPKSSPRIGHQYQVEVPSMIKESELAHNEVEDSGHEGWRYLGHSDGGVNITVPIAEANWNSSWSDADVKSFLLGLFIFGKNFVQIKRFLENKVMGEILSFYYGKFYKSDEYCRWSDCKKIKGRKCITGDKLFSGQKHIELLFRLTARVSEERKDALQQISMSYWEGRTSLEEYVYSLKSTVGLGVLVEAVGIGKGKLDLTSSAMECGKKTQACLEPCDIIKHLGGDYQSRKAKRNKKAATPSRSLPGGIWSPFFRLGHKVDFNLTEDEQNLMEIPGGIWSPAFSLGHKVNFNLTEDEENVLKLMSEQQLAEAALELFCRAAVMLANWNSAYASDRGKLRAQLNESQNENSTLKLKLEEVVAAHSGCEKKQKESAQLIADAERLMGEAQRTGRELKKQNEELVEAAEVLRKQDQEHRATILNLKQQLTEVMGFSKNLSMAERNVRCERDALIKKMQGQYIQIEEMGNAIVEEHTLRFEKALRQIPCFLNMSTDGVGFDVMKDIYQGKLVPLKDIPNEEFGVAVPAEVVPEETVEGEATVEMVANEASADPPKDNAATEEVLTVVKTPLAEHAARVEAKIDAVSSQIQLLLQHIIANPSSNNPKIQNHE
ncbi:hypothetical protein V8G54_030037 [Vigna mungo]|uniref:DUF7952 domain-containing protein n=1 Tax=Vigna mungo TaxID=3915 RepID=A0AAQ3RKW5_VIGMU